MGLSARGTAMGMAEVIPGVSGGTIALITGIYERLVRAIKSIDASVVQNLLRLRFDEVFASVHWKLLGFIGIGQVLGVLVFTKLIPIPSLIKTHPEPVYGLFFGLILGSVVVLARNIEAWGRSAVVAALAGCVAGGIVVVGVPVDTPDAGWFLFGSGAVAITAMILPGISGSFILLLLRKYTTVMGAIGSLELGILAPFALGCLVGIVAFSRVLSWLLDRARAATMAFMVGLLVASLWIIWPFQNRLYEHGKMVHSEPVWPGEWHLMAWLGVGMTFFGFVLVFILDQVSRQVREESDSP